MDILHNRREFDLQRLERQLYMPYRACKVNMISREMWDQSARCCSEQSRRIYLDDRYPIPAVYLDSPSAWTELLRGERRNEKGSICHD